MNPLLQRLASWLKQDHPHDILIPIRQGKNGKKPLTKHSNGAWTWERADALLPDPRYKDWGILQRSLCVVDIDDPAVQAELEQAYPELGAAPMETTRHGAHVYFQRSPRADEFRCFDGKADVAKVDFKTVTSTGTAGLLVVCPSANKH